MLEKKATGIPDNWCCDSQWEISLLIKINNQNYALWYIHDVNIYSGCCDMKCLFFMYWMSVLIVLVTLFLKYKVFKTSQLPCKIYIYMFEISPVMSIKSKKLHNWAERADRKAPIERTVTISCLFFFFFFLDPLNEVFFPSNFEGSKSFPQVICPQICLALRKLYFP